MKIIENITTEDAQKYAEKLVNKQFKSTILKHVNVDDELFVFETTTKYGNVLFEVSFNIFKQNKVRKPEIVRTMLEALYKAFI